MWIANRGLATWRDQQDAQVKRDAARALLDAVEDVYEAVDDARVRTGLPFRSEAPPGVIPEGELIQLRVYATSQMSERAAKVADSSRKLLDATSWAEFVLGAKLRDGPAMALATQAHTVQIALHEVALQFVGDALPVQPPGAWLDALDPEKRKLVASTETPDPFVQEFGRLRRELREVLRPYVLYREPSR